MGVEFLEALAVGEGCEEGDGVEGGERDWVGVGRKVRKTVNKLRREQRTGEGEEDVDAEEVRLGEDDRGEGAGDGEDWGGLRFSFRGFLQRERSFLLDV